MMKLNVKTFDDLLQDKVVIIKSLTNQAIVRRLINLGNGTISLDSCDGNKPLIIPLNTEIRYEPRMMDRGSLLFKLDGQILKLATEFDIVEFETTSEQFSLAPHDDILHVDKKWETTPIQSGFNMKGMPIW